MSTMSPPRDCTSPAPSVTYRVWPSAWECQAVRAPGVKWTALTRMREGASPLAKASIQTSPVNHSAGPFMDGFCGWISMAFSCGWRDVRADLSPRSGHVASAGKEAQLSEDRHVVPCDPELGELLVGHPHHPGEVEFHVLARRRERPERPEVGALVGGEHADQVAVDGDVREGLHVVGERGGIGPEKGLEVLPALDDQTGCRLAMADEVSGDEVVELVERPTVHGVLETLDQRPRVLLGHRVPLRHADVRVASCHSSVW